MSIKIIDTLDKLNEWYLAKFFDKQEDIKSYSSYKRFFFDESISNQSQFILFY